MNKNNLLILLLAIALVFLASCSGQPYEYSYTETQTNEYFQSEYESFDKNLIYTSCAQYCNSDDTSGVKYAAIEDVATDDYIACFTDSACEILRKKGNTENPINDWTVKKAVIYWKVANLSEDSYRKYGENVVCLEVHTEKGRTTLDELLNLIKNATLDSKEEYYRKDNNAIIVDPESNEKVAVNLYLRLYFKECDTICWESPVNQVNSRNYITDANGVKIALPALLNHIVCLATIGDSLK